MFQMKSVEINSVRDDKKIVFSDYDGDAVNVRIGNYEVSAQKKVYLYDGGPRISGMFRAMAIDWAGWEGEIDFESIEGDLRLVAISDKLGHIELRTTMINNNPDDLWNVSVPIKLESGSLDRIALAVEQFFKT